MGNSRVLKTEGSINVKRQNFAVVLSWYQRHYLIWICSSNALNQWFCLQVFGTFMATHLLEKTKLWVGKWILHHSHAPSCTPLLVVIFVQNLNLWTLSYLPELVQCDLFMPVKLNISLRESYYYLDIFRAVWEQDWREFQKMISCNVSRLAKMLNFSYVVKMSTNTFLVRMRLLIFQTSWLLLLIIKGTFWHSLSFSYTWCWRESLGLSEEIFSKQNTIL